MTIVMACIIIGGTSACAPAPVRATDAATPRPVKVSLDPALEPLRPLLASCVSASISLYYTPLDSNPDVILQWGQPAVSNRSLWAIGSESLVTAVHPSRKLGSLELKDLLQIYQGAISDWSQLGQPAAPLHAWAYSPDTRLAGLFNAIAPSAVRGKSLQAAPGPAEMRQAVAQDPDAIGLLPGRWVDASVKAVALSAGGSLSQPVLAGTQGSPQGEIKSWLVCVQKTLAEQTP